MYPVEMDDYARVHKNPEGKRGSGPRTADCTLAALLPDPKLAHFGWDPADPVTEISTTARALGWCLLKYGGPRSSYSLLLTPPLTARKTGKPDCCSALLQGQSP